MINTYDGDCEDNLNMISDDEDNFNGGGRQVKQ